MAYDGNGKYNRLYNWQDDASNGINIMADRMDNEFNGMADALSISFTTDGQAVMTADGDFGNHRLLRLANPVADTDGANKQWVAQNFLSNSGDSTIESSDPWIYYKETDQLSDENQWRTGMDSTSFVIEPLQSDGSPNAGYGSLTMTRDATGVTGLSFDGGPASFSDSVTATGDLTSGGALSVTGGATVGGNVTISRVGQDAGVYVNLSGDPGKIRTYRIMDNGGTLRNAVSVSSDGILTFGQTGFNPISYVTAQAGRHDFYCGTTAVDLTITSADLIKFGLGGVKSTGPVLAGAIIDTSTLATSSGLLIAHDTVNAYISNQGVGDLDIRSGGNTEAETNYRFDAAGQFRIARQGTQAYPAFKIGTSVSDEECGLYVDTSKRLAVTEGPDKVAAFDALGTAASSSITVMTREKGDARYLQGSQEFHDPTGAASWSIVGNKLECWGSVEQIGNSTTVTFPKTFAQSPAVTLTGNDTGSSGTLITWDSITATTVVVVARNKDGTGVDRTVTWHAIGEWDGTS